MARFPCASGVLAGSSFREHFLPNHGPMILRSALPILTFGLLLAVIGDRLAEARRRAEPLETANQTISAIHRLDSDTTPTEASAGRARFVRRPGVDRGARMATVNSSAVRPEPPISIHCFSAPTR